MHHALQLPEIVEEILTHNRSEPGYLHTCLLLNTFFFQCTARILWSFCACASKSETGATESSRLNPHARYLMRIAQLDAQRGKFYASLVKCLRFEEDEMSSLTRESLQYFLTSCNKLEHIDIRAAKRVWDKNIWKALSRHSSLQAVSVPDINDFWIEELVNDQGEESGTPFPALKSLKTGCSSSALISLHRILPRLRDLSLDLRAMGLPEVTPTFNHLSNFTQLSSISIQLPREARFQGSDLIRITQMFPLLSCLSIGKDQVYPDQPWGHGLTDASLETMARNAVHLKELYLLFLPPGCTTSGSATHDPTSLYPKVATIEALGRHCARLERLWLTCDLDWDSLAQPERPILFPQLWDLRIQGYELRADLVLEEEEGLERLAKGFAARCPRLRWMAWVEPYLEIPLYEYVMDVIKTREE